MSQVRRVLFFLKGLILFAVAVLSAMPCGMAQKARIPESSDYEGTAAQAQATMASLFGPQSVLPVPPQVEGTIAIPGFDSKGFQVGEEWVREGKEPDAENAPRP